MNKSVRKKLCWNCEGSVSVEEESCPFCGVTVIPAFLEGTAADFSPPYSRLEEEELDIPNSPYPYLNHEKPDNISPENFSQSKEQEEEAVDEFKLGLYAVLYLLTGSVFALFGIVLGLFSRNGVLTLHWDGSYWFMYLSLAIPLLFFGWRSLMRIES